MRPLQPWDFSYAKVVRRHSVLSFNTSTPRQNAIIYVRVSTAKQDNDEQGELHPDASKYRVLF